MPPHTSRVLKWSLVFGIVIVLNMFFNYSLSLIYKQPVYNDFCPPVLQAPTPFDLSKATVDQSVQAQQLLTCQNNYQTAQNNYDRNVFIALIILGAITVALGNFMSGNILIGQALSLSGVLSFIIASMRYWSDADNIFKVIILAIALIILIGIAVKKFKDQ